MLITCNECRGLGQDFANRPTERRHCTPPPPPANDVALPPLARVDPGSASWRAMQQTAVATVRPGAAS